MDFLTDEIIEKAGLTADQLATIKPLGESYIADLKKSWDGKANSDAEGILNGAATKIAEVTKVTRNQGEKIADYIVRAGNEHLAVKQSEFETAKSQYEQKLKDFKGDEATKAELDAAKSKLDAAQKRLAEVEPLLDKANKYDELATKYDTMKIQTAFSTVKPSFSSEANQYEVKAKWQEFVDSIQAKYNVELVDGEAMCVDKENQYSTFKLADLVAAEESLKPLITGRQQQGSGAKAAKTTKIEGVPFEINKESTNPEKYAAIREYLITKEGLDRNSKAYSDKFAEYRKNLCIKHAKSQWTAMVQLLFTFKFNQLWLI